MNAILLRNEGILLGSSGLALWQMFPDYFRFFKCPRKQEELPAESPKRAACHLWIQVSGPSPLPCGILESHSALQDDPWVCPRLFQKTVLKEIQGCSEVPSLLSMVLNANCFSGREKLLAKMEEGSAFRTWTWDPCLGSVTLVQVLQPILVVFPSLGNGWSAHFLSFTIVGLWF